MAKTQARASIAHHLTSRRGARIALVVALVAFAALAALFRGAEAPAGNTSAPDDSESTRVSELLATFPDADQQSVLIVATRADSTVLTDADIQALDRMAPPLQQAGWEVSAPTVSDDGAAAVLITPVTVGPDSADTAETIADLRATVGQNVPDGLSLQVTGGPAFGADVTSSFDGANFTLLAVTIVIVALLLIITYRSPVLWIFPLLVVGLADQLAGSVTAAVGSALDLQFDTGIISVLVFGAGTNYALLLVSRYREELSVSEDHRWALRRAWQETVGAIVASNVTVVLALLTLTLAVIPGTRGLGVSAAVGLAIAVLTVLFVLPPVLALCGRRIFWPFVPRPGSDHKPGSGWRAIAERVLRRPAVSLAAGVLILAVAATGLIGTSVGLDQAHRFRVQSESADGLAALSEHFPPGEAAPISIVADSDRADQVLDAVDGVDGVVRAHVIGQSTDGTLSEIMVTGEYTPGSRASLDQVAELRDVAHAVPQANALVGGPTATDLDAQAGNARDLLTIAPLVLAVSFLVLVLLLRSLLAPVLLLLVNLSSAVAAIGAGAWLSRVLLGQQALADQVPILAFLFLVALGIDYTIFLVHRARAETPAHGTRGGMVEAIAHTGSVITSAGIVLAGVFAALGVLPLVVLGQLGLIVGVGVLMDTLIVRTVIVPSLFGVLGDRIWWPGSPHRALPATVGTDERERQTVSSR